MRRSSIPQLRMREPPRHFYVSERQSLEFRTAMVERKLPRLKLMLEGGTVDNWVIQAAHERLDDHIYHIDIGDQALDFPERPYEYTGYATDYAAECGFVEGLAYLIEQGFACQAPVHKAAATGQVEVLRYFTTLPDGDELLNACYESSGHCPPTVYAVRANQPRS